jgi:hypothetical protein
MQPGSGTDVHHRVGAEAGELADSQPGAHQHLDGDPDQETLVGLGGAEQLGGRGVVERLGERIVLAGQFAGEHWHPGGCLGPAPFVDADEKHP